MPCYTRQTTEQLLEGITDLSLLAAGLIEMGIPARVVGESVRFNGGSYSNGKLVTQDGIDTNLLKKHVAVANLKKNAKKFGWTLKKNSTFSYEVQK